ncbi:FKBP-type peptidyl-prolyl cis-trans isomerase [Antrihabitans sp. YC2-6]|uniref:FKBP-type peptidyl-prolyl cis-trans isomerase n=1 Tax=Antrihabitans sp. YC2-6 TaxID=2799498 RepID=UPI0018F3CEFE|nr:FKBP-type peptidyl-prolyl cis-trans isomerase [Antrihabitans sp. YC2-6]MBJ8345518.1 FKBP-type peptidyl-prolyl cis-trans isomerase [Antrihabitans sp. YC2-6]
MRNSIKILTVATALVTGVSLAGCSSDDDSSTAKTTNSARSSAAAPTVDTRPECSVDAVTVTGDAGARPQITIPDDCAPPTQLLIKDITPGTGTEVAAGNDATVQYDLVTWSDKVEKDASWNRGEPFTVENVGQAQVIDGWNQGLIGLKEGGRRLLIVPPTLGYGRGGNGIKPNETLVFVIDAVSVAPGTAG